MINEKLFWIKNIPFLRKAYNKVKIIITFIFNILPVKTNKIVFDNFGGRGYGCDPKYIAEELLQQGLGLDLVWLTADMNTELPSGIRPVKYGSIRSAYELSTAKVWIDNIKNAYRVKKKPSQFYIQSWHSSLGLKKSEQDAKGLSEKYINKAMQDAQITDLMYSNNRFRADKYRNVFWYNGPVIECGVPRNSILFNPSELVITKVRSYFNIGRSQKILLYAPTFRKNPELDIYKFNYYKCMKVLSQKFSGEFVCLIRLHPNDAKESRNLKFDNQVKNASYYPDMQELLAASDVLITDYSGCMFDFCFVHKPIFLFSKDLTNYLINERDLYFNFDELPFSLAENEDSLFNNIELFSMLQYGFQCECFFQRIGLREDGNGAKVLAEIIKEKTRWRDRLRK